MEVKLNKLREAEAHINSRKHNKKDIERLAMNIATNGLLVPLLVAPWGDDEYMVVDGNRRFAAMQFLVGMGDLTEDFPVQVSDTDITTEHQLSKISLLANVARQDLDPIDTYLSVKGMLDQGMTIEGCANSLLTSQRQIKKYMKIASIHPDLLEKMIEKGWTNWAILVQFAKASEDQQLTALDQLMGDNPPSAWDIQRMFREDGKVLPNERVRQVMSEEEYVEAGGRVETDLFDDDDETIWLDRAIATDIYIKKAKAIEDEYDGELPVFNKVRAGHEPDYPEKKNGHWDNWSNRNPTHVIVESDLTTVEAVWVDYAKSEDEPTTAPEPEVVEAQSLPNNLKDELDELAHRALCDKLVSDGLAFDVYQMGLCQRAAGNRFGPIADAPQEHYPLSDEDHKLFNKMFSPKKASTRLKKWNQWEDEAGMQRVAASFIQFRGHTNSLFDLVDVNMGEYFVAYMNADFFKRMRLSDLIALAAEHEINHDENIKKKDLAALLPDKLPSGWLPEYLKVLGS